MLSALTLLAHDLTCNEFVALSIQMLAVWQVSTTWHHQHCAPLLPYTLKQFISGHHIHLHADDQLMRMWLTGMIA